MPIMVASKVELTGFYTASGIFHMHYNPSSTPRVDYWIRERFDRRDKMFGTPDFDRIQDGTNTRTVSFTAT
jgi:hypothetical protein